MLFVCRSIKVLTWPRIKRPKKRPKEFLTTWWVSWIGKTSVTSMNIETKLWESYPFFTLPVTVFIFINRLKIIKNKTIEMKYDRINNIISCYFKTSAIPYNIYVFYVLHFQVFNFPTCIYIIYWTLLLLYVPKRKFFIIVFIHEFLMQWYLKFKRVTEVVY